MVSALALSPLPVKTFRLSKDHAKKRGLAEKFARERLKKLGYLTWRGYYFDDPTHQRYHTYERVTQYYNQLKNVLTERIGIMKLHKFIQHCANQHGTPDLVAYHPKRQEFFFVEVKLENEQIASHQYQCIQYIRDHLNIPVEIHRIVSPNFRIEDSQINANLVELGITHLGLRAIKKNRKKTQGEISLKKFLKKSKESVPIMR